MLLWKHPPFIRTHPPYPHSECSAFILSRASSGWGDGLLRNGPLTAATLISKAFPTLGFCNVITNTAPTQGTTTPVSDTDCTRVFTPKCTVLSFLSVPFEQHVCSFVSLSRDVLKRTGHVTFSEMISTMNFERYGMFYPSILQRSRNITNTYEVLVRKPKVKIRFWRSRCRWEDNIKKDLK
jgi:hypothetical protein